ncbi:hypothetical protein N7510_000686 [Penicillium lagena]|uniref:uncharacterized protein n=1 Tax=Penicillium lagena TaxID=94218 RepID=UPI002542228E|nr:uncharacterized protein N7510_000686 [Penicillium lagena]KAJ5624377.1 hypothetical protein N7510_000686 [Penicillium lagena]
MEPSPTAVGPILDEDQYRWAVLRQPSAEAEQARAQQLADEARQLGLKVPEIEASAPLAASIASGMVDLSSPVLSSGSSTDRNSICGDITPSHEPASHSHSPLDQVVSSFSEITFASSDRAKPSSTRSLASLSTRPTSYCSSEGKANHHGGSPYNQSEWFAARKANRNSMLSIASFASSSDKKEKRRSSLKEAIGRIYFRRKRAPSTVVLPPESRVTVSKGESGSVERIYIESKPDLGQRPGTAPGGNTDGSFLQLEIPVFDKEALQRSLDDPQLSEMSERHRLERNRHVAFQETSLSILRRRHQAVVSARQSDNRRLEEEKSEKNIAAAIRIEERQLAMEIEQQREFERAKINSRTRIKHMEGYFRNASPPPSSSPTPPATGSSESIPKADMTTPSPARRFTRQHMEQLEQQYHAHESMDALHEARLKVLRERQELKLQEATARMEQELEKMSQQHVQDISNLRVEQQREEVSFLQALDAKKTALRYRWHLEEAILRCQLETQHGQLYGPLPPLTFTGQSSETTATPPISIPERSSSLAGLAL